MSRGLLMLVACLGCGARTEIDGAGDVDASVDAPGVDVSVTADSAPDVRDAAEESTLPCGPSTCVGCCKSDGTCAAGTSLTACGQGGEACETCGPGSFCNKPVPGCVTALTECTPQNCPGCCVQENQGAFCATGLGAFGCGHGGESCAWCAASACTAAPDGGGACQAPAICTPQSCNGCCVGDTCVSGTANDACGNSGFDCIDCSKIDATCMDGRGCQPTGE
jgi:hypothetical protein